MYLQGTNEYKCVLSYQGEIAQVAATRVSDREIQCQERSVSILCLLLTSEIQEGEGGLYIKISFR